MKEPSKYTCPKCHSENIQTYRLVYTGGVTTTSSGTIGVGIGGGHLGVGAASSSGVNVSQLAETVAAAQADVRAIPTMQQLGIDLFVPTANFISLPPRPCQGSHKANKINCSE